jgi:hypothetical protein
VTLGWLGASCLALASLLSLFAIAIGVL